MFLPSSVAAQIWIDEQAVETYSPKVPTDFYGAADTVRIVSGYVNPDWRDYEPLTIFDFNNYGHVKTMDISTFGEQWGASFNFNTYNYGNIETANVSRDKYIYSLLHNSESGSIGTANVTSSGVLRSYGHIETANVTSSGILRNYGHIETANVNEGILDVQGGSIGTLNFISGYLGINIGMDTVDIKDGSLTVGTAGNIGTAKVNDGSLTNTGGHIDTAIAENVSIRNEDYAYPGFPGYSVGTIGTAILNGGSLDNRGSSSIDKLYVGYQYDGFDGTVNADSNRGVVRNFDYASIGEVHVAGAVLYNTDFASLGTVHISQYGTVYNNARIYNTDYPDQHYLDPCPTIGTVYVSDSGALINEGHIEKAVVNGGQVYIDFNRFNPSMKINAGISVENRGKIGSLTINNGRVLNMQWVPPELDGIIKTAAIGNVSVGTGGVLQNAYGSVGSASITGRGAITNGKFGSIGEITITDEGRFLNGYIDHTIPNPSGWYPDANTTVGNISVTDSGVVENYLGAVIDSLTVSGNARFGNNRSTINTVSITKDDPWFYMPSHNVNNAYIGSLSLSTSVPTVPPDDMPLHINPSAPPHIINATNARIGDANVSGLGVVDNVGGKIDTLNISDGGVVRNYSSDSAYDSVISNATISDWAVLNNGDRSIVENAIIKGGLFGNQGTVESATIKGGTLSNNNFGDGGIVKNLRQNAGTVANSAKIENMTYANGVFDGQSGTIGTLTVAGNFEAGANWGQIDNLVFASDGSGFVTVKLIENTPAEPAMQTFAAFTAAAEVSTSVTFDTGLNAQNINWANGNLVVDASGLAEADGDSLISALGGDVLQALGFARISGIDTLRSVTLVKNENLDEVSALAVMNSIATSLEENYHYVRPSGIPTVMGDRIVISTVPEPATLFMLGLGLAGLGLARQRRK